MAGNQKGAAKPGIAKGFDDGLDIGLPFRRKSVEKFLVHQRTAGVPASAVTFVSVCLAVICAPGGPPGYV